MDDKSHLLIESIYDTLFEQNGWDEALKQIADAFKSPSVGFFEHNVIDPSDMQHLMLGIDDEMMNQYTEYYAELNPFFQKPEYSASGALMCDKRLAHDFSNKHIWDGSEFFHDWLNKMDYAHTIGQTLTDTSDRLLNFTIIRPSFEGSYSKLEKQKFLAMLKHVHKAFELHRKIENLELQSSSSEQALSSIDMAVLNITDKGKISYMSSTAARLLYSNQGLSDNNGLLVASSSLTADTLLQAAIKQAAEHSQTQNLQLPRIPNGRLKLTITPNKPQRQFLGHYEIGLTVLIEAEEAKEEILKAHYRLTDTEVEVAQLICQGKTPQQISEIRCKSVQTVRTQIKSIYSKTGVNTQSQLVALINSAKS